MDGFTMGNSIDKQKNTLELEHALAFNDLFLDRYVSAYYVNLDDLTYVTYRRTDDLTTKYGDISNFLESINKYIDECVHKDDKQTMYEAVKPDYIRENVRKKGEFSVVMRDASMGDSVYYKYHVIKGRDDAHVAIGFLDVSEEIHEKILQQEELARQVNNYESLHEMINSGMWFFDFDKKGALTAVRWSDAFRRMLGYNSKEEFPDDLYSWKKIVHPDDYEKAYNEMDATIQDATGTHIYNVEYRMKTRNRGYRWFRATGEVSRQDDGTPIQFVGIFVDINDAKELENVARERMASFEERIRLQVALNQEKEHLRVFHDIIHSAMWSMDVDFEGRITDVYWSDEFRAQLGFENELDFPNELSAWKNRIHPDDFEMAMSRLFDLIEGRVDNYDLEARIRVQSGDYRWFHAAAKMSRARVGRGGNVYGTVVDTTDAREREQMQVIIKALTEDFACVVYNDTQSDTEHVYSVNEKYRMYIPGWDECSNFSERMTLICDNMVYPEDREFFRTSTKRKVVLDNLSKGYPYFVNVRFFVDGNIEYWQVKFVVTDNSGKRFVAGFHSVDEETRRQIRHKETLTHNHEIIEILASEYSSVYYINLDSDELNPYTMNEETRNEFGQIFKSGIKYSDAYKLYVDGLICNEDKAMMLQAGSVENIKKQLKNKKTFVTRYKSNVDGVPHYCEMKFVKVGVESARPEAVALGFADKDIEIRQEQSRQQELMDARAKAEEANAAKSRFLFNMSHDIRTPMNAIMGFSDMAKKYINDPVKVVDCLDKVEISGKHLLKLINDILDMSRIESGKVVIEENKVNIAEKADEIVTMVAKNAELNNQTLNMNINVRDYYIWADVLHVNQVLLNVLGNAIKYTKPGGTITYSIEQLHCERQGYGTYRFTIADTGIGMNPEMVAHIYETFVRAQSATKSGIQGSGLGMAIAKQLVEQMGGTIDVASELGVGTTVTVDLTFKLLEETEYSGKVTKLEKDYSSSLKGKRILLVEDNELNREIAMDLLSDCELVVDEAEDGAVAVELVKFRNPDYYAAVLMDIQMPYMDGYSATRAIRRLRNGEYADLPIIAMTANAFEEDKQNAMEAGMDAHIAKPINSEELMKVLSELIY